MEDRYFVIVDLDNLTYMKGGSGVNIKVADKFKTLAEAKKELEDYDDDFNGAIYEVTETIIRDINKVK